MDNESSDRIPLKSAIAALRRELAEANLAVAKLGPQAARFHITSVKLELAVVAEGTAEASGEVSWWVLKAKGGVTVKDAVTHKVTFDVNVGDIEVGSPEETQ